MILYTKKKGLLTIFGILFGLGTFTIFGLTMSVGLIVHHKINAQNSVDIGAIYAAQKQAETLSVLSLSWDKSNKRKHIPHLTHCVAGGRSGFSVKIIHPSTVSKDLLSLEKGRHRF